METFNDVESKESDLMPVMQADYRRERRRAVLTVGVLAVWICFVLAVVTRSTEVALSEDSLSLDNISPLLFVLLAAVVFLVIFCLPSRLRGEGDHLLHGNQND